MRRARRNDTRGVAAYRRDEPANPPTGETFLIVTEGAKTEPNYFKAVRNRLELAALNVVIIHPPGTDPLTLVREAVRLRDEQAVRAKQSLGAVPYGEVWVVFDLEQTHGEHRRLAALARTLPEAAGLRFAVSDPAFEYWLLLHAEYTTAAFRDGAAVVRRLRKHWPTYAKGGVPSAEWLENLPRAVIHARQRRRVQPDPDRPDGPFTDVDQLVNGLNAATRAHLRFRGLPAP